MANQSAKPLTVDCPSCGRPVPWTEASAFRPFCSERCKLMDLGDWAAERHRIPGDELHDDVLSEDRSRQGLEDDGQ